MFQIRAFFCLAFFSALMVSPAFAEDVNIRTATPVSADSQGLLNRYYTLKQKAPDQALSVLRKLLTEEPQNRVALQEMGYFLLAREQTRDSLPYFVRAYKLKQSAHLALQIAYVQVALHQFAEAKPYLTALIQSKHQPYADKAKRVLQSIQHRTQTAHPASDPNISGQLHQIQVLQKTAPLEAHRRLEELLARYPRHPAVLNQMAYLDIQQKQNDAALIALLRSYSVKRDARIALQIAYLFAEDKRYEAAKYYFHIASADKSLAHQAQLALRNLSYQTRIKKRHQSSGHTAFAQKMLDRFYATQRNHPQKAKGILIALLHREPNNVIALRQLAYLYLAEGDYLAAYRYFYRDFQLTQAPKIAAQLGYVLDYLDHKHVAYDFFEIATKTDDPVLQRQSYEAMANLAAWKMRILQDPYFVDVYTAPFYYGRFHLGIFPVILRAGVYLDAYKRAELYTYLRYNQDTRSHMGPVSPEIFEDNVLIGGVGLRYRLLSDHALYFYAEAGRAYDLLSVPDRWHGDLRVGLFYYTQWGNQLTYQPNFQWTRKHIGDLYGDATYYSRHDHNLIATLRVREGLRFLEWRKSSMAGYLKAQLGQDTRRVYYNNYVEVGPGVQFTPNNHYNLRVRAEILHGFFMPRYHDDNPYGNGYNTFNVQLEYYARF